MIRILSKAALAAGAAVLGFSSGASALDCNSAATPQVVSSDILSDTAWGAGSVIVLERPIFVKNGATLTIGQDVVVRGQPRSGPVVAGQTAGSPGAIIVTQNGTIDAQGAATAPIIMTTAAVDNDQDGVPDDTDNNGFDDAWTSGDLFLDNGCADEPLAPLNTAGDSNTALWGGVVLLGNAPTNMENKCGVGYGKCVIEGLTVPGFPAADATYGGVLPNDSSGIMRYVSIRHAGDEIGNGNELNGLTMGGVGAGTVIDFVEVYANFDDAFEWFGGTVNGSHLAVLMTGDDGFDADQGYTGYNQFLWQVMAFFNENDGDNYGSKSSEKATEFDGDDYRPDDPALFDNVNRRISLDFNTTDNTPWPLSHPAFWNMTIIGATPDAGADFSPVSSNGTKRGIQFRNGFAGMVGNSVVVNTGGETGIEIDTGIGDGAPGFDAINNVNNDLSWLQCSTLDDGAALGAAELTTVANGDARETAVGANVVNGFLFAGLQNEDTTFDPTGNAAGKLVASLKSSPINPRHAGFSGAGGCKAPEGFGLDRSATYRGAFDSSAGLGTLWTEGWTVLDIAGLLD